MKVYHVVDTRTGVFLESAPDYRCAQEYIDNSAETGLEITYTLADDDGNIDGVPWYIVFKYRGTPAPKKKLTKITHTPASESVPWWSR